MSLVTLPPSQPQAAPATWVRDRWTNMSVLQRLLLAGVVCLVASVGLWAVKFRHPDMRALVSGLSAEDTSRIVRKLDELKIEYTLGEGGGSVQVPAADLNRVRLELAGAGMLQKSSVGFELFDRINLNTTDFTERVNYIRALQGELAETIQSIPAVQSVRVHLNIPREAAFLSDTRKPSASVMIQLKPGGQLSSHQCRGILNLVASSTEGLTPDAVTLTDTSGAFLYSGQDVVNAGSSEEEQHARQLQRTAQSVLDGVLGPGRGLASVRIEFVRDRKQSQRELFEPGPDGKPLEKSHRQTEETYQGMGRALQLPGGIPTPAVATPAPGATPTPGAGDKPKYSQTSQTVEYQVSRRTETVEESPNKIRRLTASVLIDSQAKLDKAGIDALTQAVSLALGVDTDRGDRFNLKVVTFNRDQQEEDKKAIAEAKVEKAQQSKLMLGYIGAIFGGLTFLAVLIYILFALARRRHRREQEAVEAAEALASGATAREVRGGHVDISLPAEADMSALPHPTKEVLTRDMLIENARKAVRENPELVARVVQVWLEGHS